MRLKQRHEPAPPGIVGTARVDRRTSSLLSRLQHGDIAVIDHLDLDRATAQTLVDAKVAAVVNTDRFLSGRYPSRGAGVLLEAGVALVEQVPPAALARIKDGARVRLDGPRLFVGEELLAEGVVLTAEELGDQLERSRASAPLQLVSLTHNSAELLRREEKLLLHGEGAPRVSAALAGAPALVAGAGPEVATEIAGLKAWLQQQPVVVMAVGAAATRVHKVAGRIDVLLLGPGDLDLVPAKILRAAGDVVRVGSPSQKESDSLARLGVHARVFDTSLAVHEAALLLAAAADASVIVTAGRHADVATLLDHGDSAASTLLGRLAVGDRLVDARVLTHLWSGRVRTWHLWVVLLAGLVAVVAAVAVTPVGQDWWHQHGSELIDSVQGLFS